MKSRLFAFLFHLFISALIASAVIGAVFWIWYPRPLHEAVGVTEIFLMLLSVDVIIGPLLTLIVYKPNKPSLKFDLSVIAFFQICALSYGIHTVFQGRPAFIVFAKDRFEIARASDLDPTSTDKAVNSGNSSAIAGWSKPHWVGALAPLDLKRKNEILFKSVQGGPDWPLLPELYVPLTEVKNQMLTKAKPLQELRDLHKNDKSLNRIQTDLRWLPLKGKTRNMVVLVNPKTADVVDIVDVDPWLASKS